MIWDGLVATGVSARVPITRPAVIKRWALKNNQGQGPNSIRTRHETHEHENLLAKQRRGNFVG